MQSLFSTKIWMCCAFQILIDAGPTSSLLAWTYTLAFLISLPISCSSETHSPQSYHSKIFNINWIILLPFLTLQYIFPLHASKTNTLNVLNKSLDYLAPVYSSRGFCSSHYCALLQLHGLLSVPITNTWSCFPPQGLCIWCFLSPSES